MLSAAAAAAAEAAAADAEVAPLSQKLALSEPSSWFAELRSSGFILWNGHRVILYDLEF